MFLFIFMEILAFQWLTIPLLVRMFPELRRTKRVGVFGVAYAGGGTYERCIVDPKTKKVSGFVTRWDGGRKFPVGKEFENTRSG